MFIFTQIAEKVLDVSEDIVVASRWSCKKIPTPPPILFILWQKWVLYPSKLTVCCLSLLSHVSVSKIMLGLCISA
jgi:hypothetical protein